MKLDSNESLAESGESLKNTLDYFVDAKNKGRMGAPEAAAAHAVIQEKVDEFIASLKSPPATSGSKEQELESDNKEYGDSERYGHP